MIELIFVACLHTAPDTCERQAMQFTDITARACTVGAPPHLAKWTEEHPGWRVTRWTCQPMGFEHDA